MTASTKPVRPHSLQLPATTTASSASAIQGGALARHLADGGAPFFLDYVRAHDRLRRATDPDKDELEPGPLVAGERSASRVTLDWRRADCTT